MGESMQVKRRNLGVQFLLMVVTFGFYSFYWYYVTMREMLTLLEKNDENVFIWTVFLAIPFLFFYPYYKQGEAFEQLSNGAVNRWVMLFLWVFFPPAVWLIVQLKLNKIASEQTVGAVA